jgi:hypothetical protein
MTLWIGVVVPIDGFDSIILDTLTWFPTLTWQLRYFDWVITIPQPSCWVDSGHVDAIDVTRDHKETTRTKESPKETKRKRLP